MKKRTGILEIVVPAYNEEKIIVPFVKTVREVLEKSGIRNKILFVDDGSADGTWAEITAAKKNWPNVEGISFSRNFGKESAIAAGLEASTGDCVAVMDADLQHPPAILAEMYEKWQDGADVVEGIKRSRGKEKGWRRNAAEKFYEMMGAEAKTDMSQSSDYKLLDRQAVQEILRLKEHDQFFRAQSSWIGFHREYVEYDVQERAEGESKWTTKALVRYAVNNLTSYSFRPLYYPFIGAAANTFAFLIFLILSILISAKGSSAETLWALTIITAESAFFFASLGIIGIYLAKSVKEEQNRPRYIVTKTTKNEAERDG